MSLNFNGNYIGGVPSGGGGGGATNHAQLTNLDYANSGHTGFMSNENYIPGGTIINVGATRELTTIGAAYEYIQNKWSGGTVTIHIDAGTYNETLNLDKASIINIPQLIIEGDDKDTTTIFASITSDWQNRFKITGHKGLILKDITLTSDTQNTTMGLNLASAEVEIKNINILNSKYCGINLTDNSVLKIFSTTTIKNETVTGSMGINIQVASKCVCERGAEVEINNFTTGINTASGSMAAFNKIQATFTNVTTRYVPELNVTTANNAWNVRIN